MFAEPRPPRLMGGVFGLEDKLVSNDELPAFLNPESLLLVNARSGVFLLVERLMPSVVWLPSYVCDSIVVGINQNVTQLRFYEVDYDLRIPSLEWLDEVRKGDLVVFIDYFGFPNDKSCALHARERGAWILEDACQALLSEPMGSCADFILFSPRKFLGVPDGGILAINCKADFTNLSLTRPPCEWWLEAVLTSVLRREFDIYGGLRRWFELFQKVEAGQPVGHYAMSDLSWGLLNHGFDYTAIAKKRINNYRYLTAILGKVAVFPSLPGGVVPLGFPIRVKNRDKIRQDLFDHGIYPPVHWPIQDLLPNKFKDSHRLAAEIMTLPCDQRYTQSDLQRMAEVVEAGLRR